MSDRNVDQILESLDTQRGKLRRIHNEYSTGYDAAFEEHSAYVSLQLWCDRTMAIIEAQLGRDEAKSYQHAISSAPRGRGAWRWREVCEYFDTYLIRLIEDVVDHPLDAVIAETTGNGTQDSVPTSGSSRQDHSRIFLSYSRDDRDEARKIYDELVVSGKECFMDEKSLKPGDRFEDAIRDAIAAADEVWILVSPSSIESDWVQREASAAWALQKRIVPVLFRCGPDKLPDFLAGANSIDFHEVFSYIAQSR